MKSIILLYCSETPLIYDDRLFIPKSNLFLASDFSLSTKNISFNATVPKRLSTKFDDLRVFYSPDFKFLEPKTHVNLLFRSNNVDTNALERIQFQLAFHIFKVEFLYTFPRKKLKV